MFTKIRKNLTTLYSEESAGYVVDQLQEIIQEFHKEASPKILQEINKSYKLSSSDIALITYANTIVSKKPDIVPLEALRRFVVKHGVDKVINTVHLLPFYPWDTDRGFSVADYYKIHPDYGSWADVRELGGIARLMFDFVANHASIKNPLVQHALIERHLDKNDPQSVEIAKFKDFAIAFSDEDKPSEEDLKSVTRPRPNPILTRYTVFETREGELRAVLGEKAESNSVSLIGKNVKRSSFRNIKILGKGWVWTTFSRPQNKDGSEATRQVDLNFANPEVLIETIRILLFYVRQEADLIRLDAIGYIWKKLGSTSLHEPEAHLILEIIYEVMSIVAPRLLTIAEVNERQSKIVEYLGKPGHKESDLVYQFTHFPLALYSVFTEDASYYIKWLDTLEDVGGKQFITVLGSHDGVGLKPLRDILPEEEIQLLIDRLVEKHDALPNYAQLAGGAKIVYEICATPWHLVNNPNAKEPLELQLRRFLAVVALGLMVRGLPAFYINGLIGAPNYLPEEGLDENRTINRQVFSEEWLRRRLDSADQRMRKVLDGVKQLLRIRASEKVFDPNAPAIKVVDVGNKAVVSALLESEDKKEMVWALVNVSVKEQKVKINLEKEINSRGKLRDILSDIEFNVSEFCLSFNLSSYQVVWLKVVD